MSDDIVFIKDENDYNEYSKLKPVNTYKYKKVKFICTVCKKESTKSFRNLKIPFKCRHCTIVENNTSKEYRDKFRKTCLLRYGVEHPKKLKSVNEKTKQTCIKRYGVTSYLKTNECKDAFKKKYNADNPLQVPEIKEEIQKTCLEHYGETQYLKTEKSIKQRKNTFIKKYGAKTYKESTEYYNKWLTDFTKKLKLRNFEYIKTENNRRYIKCLNCNNIFSFSISGFNVLLKKYKESFCPYCTKIPTISYEEKELSRYIETIYNGIIINNIKSILPNNKEIDIYLPDLRLGFEFDGTYWHADSRFYNENDLIWHKKITAAEIWKRDKEKDILAESLNILLIRIKEYDWIHNINQEMQNIKEIIENRKNELSLQTE